MDVKRTKAGAESSDGKWEQRDSCPTYVFLRPGEDVKEIYIQYPNLSTDERAEMWDFLDSVRNLPKIEESKQVTVRVPAPCPKCGTFCDGDCESN